MVIFDGDDDLVGWLGFMEFVTGRLEDGALDGWLNDARRAKQRHQNLGPTYHNSKVGAHSVLIDLDDPGGGELRPWSQHNVGLA